MTGERVFIIEDEAVVSEFLRTKLESIDYDVVGEAKRGEDAVTYCKENSVDILLADIKLDGELDGIETARKITEENNCVIIYITAYSESDLLERAKQTEPAGYLIKPIDEEELVCTMEIALFNRTLKEERKQALEERNQALQQKEELLDEIRDVVDRNSQIMSELLDLQISGSESPDLNSKRNKAIESLLDLKQKLDEVEDEEATTDDD